MKTLKQLKNRDSFWLTEDDELGVLYKDGAVKFYSNAQMKWGTSPWKRETVFIWQNHLEFVGWGS